VLMYEWITGVHPFQGASPLATLARVVDSHPESLALRAEVPRTLAEIVARCLRKAPSDRFQSAADLLDAFQQHSVTPGPSMWWRVHQVAAMILYVVATTRAWQIKEWLRPDRMALWAFIFMGIAASVGGIVRGHLIFTDAMNHARLPAEMRRTRRAVLSADVLMALTLAADALLLATIQPLASVLTFLIAAGIALAAILMEPATTSAVFGDLR